MELRCSRCPQLITGNPKVCPACGAPVVEYNEVTRSYVLPDESPKDEGDSASPEWRPVSLPKGLVDDGIGASAEMDLNGDKGVKVEKNPLPEEDIEPAYGMVNGQVMNNPAASARQPFNARQKKMIMLMAVGLAIVLLGLGLVIGRHLSKNESLYVAWPVANVYSDPAYGLPIHILSRGETVFKLDVQGPFYKISDLDGKIGFVEKSKLSEKKQPYIKGSSFYGCKQYLSEDSPSICEKRAEEQFNECNESCAEDISGSCKATCQNLLVTCKSRCGK